MSASDVQIGKWGRIKQGTDQGLYLFVKDDAQETGGFFIFRGPEKSLEACFDSWVERREGLDKFFQFEN